MILGTYLKPELMLQIWHDRELNTKEFWQFQMCTHCKLHPFSRIHKFRKLSLVPFCNAYWLHKMVNSVWLVRPMHRSFHGPKAKIHGIYFCDIYLLYEEPSGVWRNSLGFSGWPIACTAIWNQIALAFFHWGWINCFKDSVPKSLHINIVHDFCFWKLKHIEMDKNFSN